MLYSVACPAACLNRLFALSLQQSVHWRQVLPVTCGPRHCMRSGSALQRPPRRGKSCRGSRPAVPPQARRPPPHASTTHASTTDRPGALSDGPIRMNVRPRDLSVSILGAFLHNTIEFDTWPQGIPFIACHRTCQLASADETSYIQSVRWSITMQTRWTSVQRKVNYTF